MSSYAPYDSAAEAAEGDFIKDCVVFSLLALVVYEYVVTMDREVDVVWRRKLTAPSLMLLVSRWLMLLGPIAGNIPITSIARYVYAASFMLGTTTHLYRAHASYQGIWCLTIITYALSLSVVAIFSALRVYAILLRGRMKSAVSAVVGVLGFIPVATNTYKWARTTLVPTPPSGYSVIAIPEEIFARLLHLATASAIAVEAIVLATTWVKSYQHFREMRRLRMESSVTTILLRDGTLYFIVMLVINLCQLLTYKTTSIGGSYSNIFMLYMPPLLVQRFMMNLRQLTREPSEMSYATEPPDYCRSVRFRAPPSFLGNIGEPLEDWRTGEAEDDDYYEEEEYGSLTSASPV